MKTKLLLWLAVANISMAAWSSEPEALNVHCLDAAISSTMLDNIQSIRFSEDETEILIHTVDQQNLTNSIPDIFKVTFGNYIVDNEITLVETPYIASQNDVQKLIQNGQLVIVKGAAKYNILGIRL